MTTGQPQPEHEPARPLPWQQRLLSEALAQLRQPVANGSTPPTAYRASDADREHVTQLLGQAMGAGQIDIAEFDQRTQAVYAAKTHAELEALTRDLNVRSLAAPLAVIPGAGPQQSNLFGVFGGVHRRGPWMVPRTLNVFVLFGGGFLDLREASFASPEIRINVFSLLGRTKVIVPRELDLRVEGVELMGSFEHKASGPGTSSAGGSPARMPKILVNGVCVWGGVNVERPRTKGRALLKKILKGR